MLFFWLLLFGNQGLYELENLRHLKASFIHQTEALQNEQKELKEELKNLDNPEYLKHLIHKELGYVADDEVIVKFPPKETLKKE